MDGSNEGAPGLLFAKEMLISVSFVVGAAANVAALWILYKSAKTRNNKHVLMLRCLATNDLVAQVGMLVLINLPKDQLVPLQCVLYVCFRAFGLGSGCVAFVMAVERWLALTRPFLYQQVITYRMVKRSIFGLWMWAVFLSYLPLLGFGLYYSKGQCCRYRDAKQLKDVIYAYLFLIFGVTLCICIAICNLTVVWKLSRMGHHRRVVVRRVNRTIISNPIASYANYATPEEVAFAKLMAVICVIFTVCWLPQMISIPMAQFYPNSSFCRVFSRIADVLMCVYFTLDPYVYVLQRYMEKGGLKLPCGSVRRSLTTLPPATLTRTPTSLLLSPPTFPIAASIRIT